MATPSSEARYVIFTESQSTDAGSIVMHEYLSSSRRISARLVSVILDCDVEINEDRVRIRALNTKSAGTAKLSDVDVLRWMRDTATGFRFGGEADLEILLDVSVITAAEAAKEIKRRIMAM